MTDKLYLDPEELAALEPREEQAGLKYAMSWDSVPTRILITPTLRRMTLDFVYPSGETGTIEETIDRLDAPKIIVRMAQYTRKVLQLRIEPVCYNESWFFQHVSDRLWGNAPLFERKSQQFSLRLVAGLVRHFSEQLANLADEAFGEIPVAVVIRSGGMREGGGTVNATLMAAREQLEKADIESVLKPVLLDQFDKLTAEVKKGERQNRIVVRALWNMVDGGVKAIPGTDSCVEALDKLKTALSLS